MRVDLILGWLATYLAHGTLLLGAGEVCLPARAVAELSGAELDAVLAHEIAHLAWRDGRWRAAALLVERLFVVQPPNALAAARLHALAERACDDRPVQRTDTPLALASALARADLWRAGDTLTVRPRP